MGVLEGSQRVLAAPSRDAERAVTEMRLTRWLTDPKTSSITGVMEKRLSARESRKITTGFRLPLDMVEWLKAWSCNLESNPGDMVSRICDRFIKEVDMPRSEKASRRYTPMQFRKAVLLRIEDYAAARGLTRTDVILAALKREMGSAR